MMAELTLDHLVLRYCRQVDRQAMDHVRNRMREDNIPCLRCRVENSRVRKSELNPTTTIGVKGGNIQTILVESEQEVQPPVNIGHIQWLDMHDWKERHAPRVVRSLAFQLATRLPDYRKLLLTLPEIDELDRKDAVELFDYLLANPLRSGINGGRQRYLIVIDALDEAGEAGRNSLVEMLARNAQRLPNWFGLVVTSRPEFDVKTPLQALNPFSLDTPNPTVPTSVTSNARQRIPA